MHLWMLPNHRPAFDQSDWHPISDAEEKMIHYPLQSLKRIEAFRDHHSGDEVVRAQLTEHLAHKSATFYSPAILAKGLDYIHGELRGRELDGRVQCADVEIDIWTTGTRRCEPIIANTDKNVNSSTIVDAPFG